MTSDGGRAVVLGGGMAGLLAARVLADAYGSVVVVDRDVPGGGDARRGVPQGGHVHGLLARGQQVLEELFPGLTAGLAADGVPTCDVGGIRLFLGGARIRPAETGMTLVVAVRPVLEAHVRERVAKLPNVELLDGADAIEPVVAGGRVAGVRIQRHDRDAPEELTAGLVVDATGRGSRTPAWLAALGYPEVPEDTVGIDLAYASREFRLRTDPFRGEPMINAPSGPPVRRGAFMHTLGGDRCLVTLHGVLGDRPPADDEGFLEFARSLPVPDIADALADAEPVTPVRPFRFPASRRRRYERLDRFPAGLLVLGDATCSLNPIYGQGMSLAALHALVLRDHLARGPVPAPGPFFADVARAADVPWEMSANGDLGYPDVPGERPLRVRLGNAWTGRVILAATRDPEVARELLHVIGLDRPPTRLFRPVTVARVLRANRQAARAAA